MRRRHNGSENPAEARTQISKWLTLAAILLFSAPELSAGGGGETSKAKGQPAQTEAPAATEADSPRRIVISIPDRKLALMEGDRVVKVYRVAVGAPASPSPSGQFTIATRIPQPTYYAPGKVIPPGPGNPLGTRWLGLSLKGFGIHGTNEPRSIGKRASHGCIRMRNADVEELFELVRAGDVVELHCRRSVELAQIFGSSDAARPKAQPAQVGTPVVVATTLP